MHNVAIIDDHPVALVGLRSLIEGLPSATVIGLHERSKSLISALCTALHHTVIVDYHLASDDLECEKVIEILRRQWPTVGVVVFSAVRDAKMVRNCLRAGATTVLCKADSSEHIREQLRMAMLDHRRGANARPIS